MKHTLIRFGMVLFMGAMLPLPAQALSCLVTEKPNFKGAQVKLPGTGKPVNLIKAAGPKYDKGGLGAHYFWIGSVYIPKGCQLTLTNDKGVNHTMKGPLKTGNYFKYRRKNKLKNTPAYMAYRWGVCTCPTVSKPKERN